MRLISFLGLLLLFSNCAKRNVNKVKEEAYILEIQDAFIQQEVPGVEDGLVMTYLNVYLKKSDNVDLKFVEIDDQKIGLNMYAKIARGKIEKFLNWKPGAKSHEGVLYFEVDGEAKEINLPFIEVKEPLFMP